MGNFAEKTTVPEEKTRAELEATVNRYGATSYAYACSQERAMIQFELKGRRIKLEVSFLPETAKEFLRDGRGSARGDGWGRKERDNA